MYQFKIPLFYPRSVINITAIFALFFCLSIPAPVLAGAGFFDSLFGSTSDQIRAEADAYVRRVQADTDREIRLEKLDALTAPVRAAEAEYEARKEAERRADQFRNDSQYYQAQYYKLTDALAEHKSLLNQYVSDANLFRLIAFILGGFAAWAFGMWLFERRDRRQDKAVFEAVLIQANMSSMLSILTTRPRIRSVRRCAMTDNIATAGNTPEKKKGFFAMLADIEFWAKVSEIAGLVMCFVSACFTVRLMRSFATDSTEYWLYTVYGATVQLSQNCLFVYSVYLHRAGQGFKALTAFVLFCLLFVLSLAGTMGSFIVSNKVQNNQELTQDTRLKDMQARAKSLDRQIEASQRLISSYASKKIMTKGAIPEGQRLDALNAERNKLSEDMANYKTEGTSDALHIALGKMFDTDSEDAKIRLFTLYAIALDLVSAVMLAFSLGLLSGAPKTVSEPVKEAAKAPETGPNPVIISKTAPAMQARKMTAETAQATNIVDSSVQYSTEGKNGIGFIAHPGVKADAGNDPVKAYLETAYRGEDRPKALMGRRAIADRIGISNKETDEIHAILKRRGIVSVRGNKTVPEMTLTEALTVLA